MGVHQNSGSSVPDTLSSSNTQEHWSEMRHSETELTAESRGSHQKFPRDTHRICEFQHEAVELVDTQLPSPQPTLMSKHCRAENQAFSSLKMRPQLKHILPSSVSSFANWLKPYDKRPNLRHMCCNVYLSRNNNLTNYHNYLNFSKEKVEEGPSL